MRGLVVILGTLIAVFGLGLYLSGSVSESNGRACESSWSCTFGAWWRGEDTGVQRSEARALQHAGTLVGLVGVGLVVIGAALPPEDAPQRSVHVAVSPTPAGTLRCFGCHARSPLGARFCVGCGKGLAPAALACRSCGAELSAGEAFCGRCGARGP